MPNLPTVSAKFVADVEGMLAQLKRADNATKSTASSIDKEVDELGKKLKKKFQLADVGKDLLRGLGVGSGFEIARTAAEAIAGYYERAAEASKAMEEATAHQVNSVKELIKLRQTPEQQIKTLQDEEARMQNELKGLQNPGSETHNIVRRDREGFEYVNKVTTPIQLTDEQKKRLTELPGLIQDVGLEIAKLQKPFEEGKINNALTDFFQSLDEQSANSRDLLQKDLDARIAAAKKFGADMASIKEISPEDEARATEELRKWNEELRQQADGFEQLIDPALKFKKQLDEIAMLERIGIPIAGGYAEAIAAVKREMAADEKSRIEKSLSDFFGDLDRQSDENMKLVKRNSVEIERVVGVAADGMSSAWVDAINGVQGAWGNLADTIIKEIERVIAHLLIVKPLINSLGDVIGTSGILGTVGAALSNYGGPRARGGAVDAGFEYRVNEDGQEYFKPNVGGTVIPVGASGGPRARGGDTYFIDATGADSGAIARLESMIRSINGTIERRAVSAVIAAKRAGGGPAAALA